MEPLLGEIIMFAGNFAPKGFAFCDGQLLAVNSNQSLFSLLGTMYGGDGRTSFGLPDLRGRVAIHQGKGPAVGTDPELTLRRIGQRDGLPYQTLGARQLPVHTHVGGLKVTSKASDDDTPTAATSIGGGQDIFVEASADQQLIPGSVAVGSTGGSSPMNNTMPSQAVHYIIALQGIFPSRN